MSEAVFLIILAAMAGGVSGFAAAAIFIKARQHYLDERALSFRKAARRLENANRLESARLALGRGSF